MKYLKTLGHGMVVGPILDELDAHPELWNQHTMRTGYGDSPHHVDDIWIRYRDLAEFRHSREGLNSFLSIEDFVRTEHESVWYSSIDVLPALKSLIFLVMRAFECERLGGVLITRIPPGGDVKPHTDSGWHATYYEKVAVQLRSAPGQAFWYEDGEFECESGTIYTFDNSQPHAVYNRSDQERVTCIICVRRDQRKPPLWQSVAS